MEKELKEISPCGCEITHGTLIGGPNDGQKVTILTYPVELKPDLKKDETP